MKKITFLFTLLVISAFSTLQSQSIATYDIVFTSTWNATDHGTLPPNPHWSRLVGANHNSNVSFIEVGGMSTLGIELIAESGTNDQFEDVDVQNAINDGNAEKYIYGPSLSTAAGTITISGLEVSESFPLLSLFTMVAPSPDWMMVIDDLELLDSGGNWKNMINIPVLYAYDAGTDAGTNYTSGNSDVNMPVTVFDGSNPIAPFNGNSIGYLTVTLTNVLSVEENEALENVTVFPNPAKGKVTVTNTNNLESIEVYNILGSQIKTIAVGNNNNRLELDLSSLNQGMYLLRLNDIYGRSKTQKLILE